MFGRAKLAELAAEFLGAGFLTYAMVAALTKGSLPAAWAAGLVFVVGILWFGRGHFNPAVTVGFWTAGKIKTLRAVAYIIMQILGAFAAIQLFYYISGNHLDAGDPDFKAAGLVSELLGAFVLAMSLAVAVFRKFTLAQKAAIAGLGVALGVLVAGSAASLGLINPAVALTLFGVGSGVWGVYVVGPVVGAIVAVNLYALLFDDERVAFKSAVKKAEVKVSGKSTSTKRVTANKKSTKKSKK